MKSKNSFSEFINFFNQSFQLNYFFRQFLGSFLAQLFLYVNFYDAINDFDGGFRSAYGTNTSTG